jgi:hypothetical protein
VRGIDDRGGANIAPEGGEWGLDCTGLVWIGVWIRAT